MIWLLLVLFLTDKWKIIFRMDLTQSSLNLTQMWSIIILAEAADHRDRGDERGREVGDSDQPAGGQDQERNRRVN